MNIMHSDSSSTNQTQSPSDISLCLRVDSSSKKAVSVIVLDSGEEITVTIRADNYGGLGRIVETLPSGFTSPDASGQTVKLRLLQGGPQTRSYTGPCP